MWVMSSGPSIPMTCTDTPSKQEVTGYLPSVSTRARKSPRATFGRAGAFASRRALRIPPVPAVRRGPCALNPRGRPAPHPRRSIPEPHGREGRPPWPARRAGAHPPAYPFHDGQTSIYLAPRRTFGRTGPHSADHPAAHTTSSQRQGPTTKAPREFMPTIMAMPRLPHLPTPKRPAPHTARPQAGPTLSRRPRPEHHDTATTRRPRPGHGRPAHRRARCPRPRCARAPTATPPRTARPPRPGAATGPRS